MYKQHAQSAPSTALADACSTPQLPQPDLAGAGERFGGGSTALQVLGLHLASTEVSFPVLSPDFFFPPSCFSCMISISPGCPGAVALLHANIRMQEKGGMALRDFFMQSLTFSEQSSMLLKEGEASAVA